MIRKKYFLIVALFTATFMFACSEKFPLEEVTLIEQEITTDYDDENFVSPEQALYIAEKFLNRDPDAKTRAFASAKVETVRDEKNSNNPTMHVINYPEGGWLITSATRNYFPVLAYSDEGSFDLEDVHLSGVSVWMAETKEFIRVSDELDTEAKAQINSQWMAYEEGNIRKTASVPQTRGYQEMYDRIDQLAALYPYSTTHWRGAMSLYDAQAYLDLGTYQELVDFANSIGSPPEYTIVGIRNSAIYTPPPTYTQNGPLIETKWHQDPPYNILCPMSVFGNLNCDAGCAAIAVAQIMKYHKKPSVLIWKGVPVDWNYLPEIEYVSSLPSISTAPVLVAAVGDAVKMHYGLVLHLANPSWATSGNVVDGLRNYGYNVTRTSTHNITTVSSEIYNNRPVLMLGYDGLFGGHYWVCSGVDASQTHIEYYVEFYYNGSYSYSPAYYFYATPSNPLISTTAYTMFHMNWGWENGPNGWYSSNFYNKPSGFNFISNRENFYISK